MVRFKIFAVPFRLPFSRPQCRGRGLSNSHISDVQSKGASLTPAWCSDLTPPLPPNPLVEYVADSIKDLEEGKATRENNRDNTSQKADLEIRKVFNDSLFKD